jgi:4-hydroxy-3-methylbut-2-enyl diphosphate reductase
MKLIRATHLGMCFGVKDAINLALATVRQEPLTVLGDLVHNPTVTQELQAAGIQFETRPASLTTATVMVTAHGAAERTIQATRQQGHKVLEATCPLVHFAHRSLQNLVVQGFHPVVIGRSDHVEVRGLTGDLAEFDVILTEADIARLKPRAKFGIIAQTTQPIEKVRHLVQYLREHFPAAKIQFTDTVCQPTKQRQTAARELAQQCDVVVVIGGLYSNNTQELVRTCRQFCARVHLVQTAADLSPDWFHPGDIIGLTAGTSTPDTIINAVEKALLFPAPLPTTIHTYQHILVEDSP